MAPVSKEQLLAAIKVTHYTFPAVSFVYFLIALSVTVCTLQTRSQRISDQHVRRDVILSILLLLFGTYVAELLAVAIRCHIDNEWELEDDLVMYLITSAITFGIQILALLETKFPVWYPYSVTWFLGLLVESVLLIVPNILVHPTGPFDFVFIAIETLRILAFAILPILYFGLRNDEKEYDNNDAERQSLLRKNLAKKSSSSDKSVTNGKDYGTTGDTSAEGSETATNNSQTESEDAYLADQKKAMDMIAKRLKQDGDWFTYAKGFTVFLPHIWPTQSKALQFRAFLVGICLLASNALNVLVPRQLGAMFDSWEAYADDKSINPYIPVIIYATLRYISGDACIGWIRKWLWLPVDQYSYDAISTASHAHLMGLSSDFHDNKTTSELSQAINGGRSVTQLMEMVLFQVMPMFIDLTVAFSYLSYLFGPYMGLILAVEATAYLYLTTKLYAMKAEKRRGYVSRYRKEWTTAHQSLDGWATASLFNQIPYEKRKYACAVEDHMRSKKSYEMSTQMIAAVQGMVLTAGFLGALFLGAYQVLHGEKSIGDAILLITYFGQLQGPLVFFSSMYRTISYSLMDAERLLELFQTKPTIVNSPDARPLNLSQGEVQFDRVSFAYDQRKPTLTDVTFTVPAGKTIALVGETGGGKTTILKLMDRFYDVESGSICIDGQDVRDVTVESLREKIGVVPQDPTLFNDSIMNNIRYAKLTASDQEVYEACKAAAVHDKIMSFPDGYNSKVGDRGVKLSGGEKQRVAIARAMLKQPDIILLDEATSAVDTETESLIQEGLKKLCKDRTTFIVAHRLSTVMRADRILVVMNGEIIEQGSHFDLIHARGKYHDLWSKQILVKPGGNERSRSKSPKKRDADLINDISPTRRTVDLAKALETTEHQEPQDKEEQKVSDQQKPGADQKRERSKLKPDAPEFVPLRSKVEPNKSTAKFDLKTSAKPQKKQEKDERKDRFSLNKKAGKATGKRTERVEDTKGSTGDESQITGPSNEPFNEGDGADTSKPKPKNPRNSRRNMAKSEPSRAHESVDGGQDSDVTAVSSGEGQPLLQGSAMQRRRVSAPSDPPVSSQDTHGKRARRNRHWRLKNRGTGNAGTSTSAATSSGEVSTDDRVTVPTTSPVEGPQQTTTIRFAPGC